MFCELLGYTRDLKDFISEAMRVITLFLPTVYNSDWVLEAQIDGHGEGGWRGDRDGEHM